MIADHEIRTRPLHRGQGLEHHRPLGEPARGGGGLHHGVLPAHVVDDERHALECVSHATDYVEIRLPLRNRDLPFIDLPESYRFADVTRASQGRVEIRSDLGGEESWDAVLVRTEGAIDETARQLHVIAQIDDPFGRDNEDQTPIKIGQYVTARLEGKTVPAALVIPNNTIYQGSYVYIVEDGVLRRRDIEIAWQNDLEAIIGAGLQPGDNLVMTPLGQVTSGIRVSVVGEQSDRRISRNIGETDQ